MAEETGISWCDSTINLWIGCTQLSPACDFCYAKTWAARFKIPWNVPPQRTADASWNKIESYQRGARKFYLEHGRRRRVFINSLSDFFDNQADSGWRMAACDRMAAARDVVFILVTKRPKNVVKMVPRMWLKVWPENVWLITTAENRFEYRRRVFELCRHELQHVPNRGVSFEPLLERFDVTDVGDVTMSLNPWTGEAGHLLGMGGKVPPLRWAIFGGESGRAARPYDEDGAAVMMAQIRLAGQAVFSKQLGQAEHPKTFGDFETFPPALQYRQFPDEVAA